MPLTGCSWTRVTPRNRCPICQHDGWCAFTGDGRSVKCMRVTSDRPTRDGGFMHVVGNGHAKAIFKSAAKVRHPVAIDAPGLLAGWRQQQQGELERFAATLNVSRMALESLGCVYAPEHRAFAFPMRDASGAVTGIRLRNDVGQKWAVTGSRQGLFLAKGGDVDSSSVQTTVRTAAITAAPTVRSAGAATLIVEGPTDAAAAIDLGFAVIGRPACLGCEEMIAQVVRQSGNVTTLIVADADTPGQRGAEKLQAILRKAKIITLPAKDLRQFKADGGTRELLNAVISAAV